MEIGQLKPEFTNVFDFSDFPRIQEWMDDMSQVPGHDEVHVVMKEMGDISQEAPSMDTIKNANKQAFVKLQETLASF